MLVISCFDHSTEMVKPWARAGYLCYCVDMQHPAGETKVAPNIITVGGDIREWYPPRGEVVFASFFPPCTDLAVSGASWFKQKGLGRLATAIELFDVSIRMAESLDCPYMIENPVSTISTYWRKPDYSFDPYEYGGYCKEDPDMNAYTKKTCLWTGGGFVMPPTKAVEPVQGSKMHKLGPSPERAALRSKTPEGFALAVYEANKAVWTESRKRLS